MQGQCSTITISLQLLSSHQNGYQKQKSQQVKLVHQDPNEKPNWQFIVFYYNTV